MSLASFTGKQDIGGGVRTGCCVGNTVTTALPSVGPGGPTVGVKRMYLFTN